MDKGIDCSMVREEDEQPDLKKQKLEGEANVSEEKMEKKHEEKEEEVDDYMSEEFFKELQIYYREVNESDGFQVGAHEKLHEELIGAIVRYYDPPEMDFTDKEDIDYLNDLAQTAIDYYNNEKGTSYGNVHVLRANTEPTKGLYFYITFEALNNEFSETFQAKVYVGVPSSHVEVEFVRVKPNNNPAIAN